MRLTLIALSLSILFFSCDDDMSLDGTGDNQAQVPENVNMNFKLVYGDSPLVMFEDISYPDGTKMRITKVSGYITDLVASNGSEKTTLKEVDYLEISESHLNADAAAKGFDYNLPISTNEGFDAISFNLGLPASINEDTTPSNYSSNSPLSKTGEYWSNWGSYIFWKIEGNIDFNGDDEYGAGENVALHLGSDNAYKPVSLTTEDATTNLDFTIDIEKVFNNDGVIYDIEAMPTIHASLTDEVLNRISQLADNLGAAFSWE